MLKGVARAAKTAGLSALAALLFCAPVTGMASPAGLKISANHRYLVTTDGRAFFWLGDTAWLMLERLTRQETLHYLDTRHCQGFNVIQVMVLHAADQSGRAGGMALIDGDVTRPRVTPGTSPTRPGAYDYWDHLDWVIRQAAARGIYVALVPAWGSMAGDGKLSPAATRIYTRFLARRYGRYTNVIWLTGGDTRGDANTATWQAMGATLKARTHGQLITFHPRGRTDSSWWFQSAPWLDFDMFQSGHKSYAQDASDPDAHGEDNWRYVTEDLARAPRKPTIDGEPSYENIPQGLHDVTQPRWQAADVRRYAYWAVFAGAFGHSYGDNDVMQFYVPGRYSPAFGADTPWQQALNAPGATQMRYLAALIRSRPMLSRVPDPAMVVDTGTRYDRVLATRGNRYAMAYSYTGAPFRLRLGRIAGASVAAHWFDPRTGRTIDAGRYPNRGIRSFDPPGDTRPGNDWVLMLDSSDIRFVAPRAPTICRKKNPQISASERERKS